MTKQVINIPKRPQEEVLFNLIDAVQDIVDPSQITKIEGNVDDALEDPKPADPKPADSIPDTSNAPINPDPNPEEISEEDLQKVSNDLAGTINDVFSEAPSKEALEFKEELLKEFGGADLDKDGNILDKEGNVIKSFKDLTKEIANQEASHYDDKGNLVDKEGNVLVSKQELDLENSEVNQLAKDYNLVDDKGERKVYAEGKEGFEELALDLAHIQNENFKNEFLNSNPILREVAKHLLAGKDLADFDKPIDYKSVEIKDLSKAQKLDYIKQSYISDVVSKERAENIVKGMSDKDIDDALTEAMDVLNLKEDDKNQQRQIALEQQMQQEQENTNAYWNEVNGIISKGDLNGFNIPDADRQHFFNYLALPAKDGLSQDQLDRQNRTRETELREAYYRFKGYDIKDVLKDSVNKSNYKNLRNKLAKTRELSGHKSKLNKGNSKEVDISLDSLI